MVVLEQQEAESAKSSTADLGRYDTGKQKYSEIRKTKHFSEDTEGRSGGEVGKRTEEVEQKPENIGFFRPGRGGFKQGRKKGKRSGVSQPVDRRIIGED